MFLVTRGNVCNSLVKLSVGRMYEAGPILGMVLQSLSLLGGAPETVHSLPRWGTWPESFGDWVQVTQTVEKQGKDLSWGLDIVLLRS